MKKLFHLIPLLLLVGCIAWPGIDNKRKPAVYSALPPPSQPLSPHALQKIRQPLLRLTAPRLANLTGGSYSIDITWDASTDPTVTGYNVYQGGASRAYTNIVPVGLSSQPMLEFSNIQIGGTYFFAVTSTGSGLESAYSSEVSAQIPPPNFVVVGVQVQVTDNPSQPGPWKVYADLPVITLTNPVNPAYFRSVMTITQTNNATQVLRINTSTLVLTNK
jgi:hypothetical protein